MLPALIERFDLSRFDLVISSSHCVAKGAIAAPGVPHICYCHTPMRYVWDQFDAYFGPGRARSPGRLAMRAVAPALRDWDRRSAQRVTAFVANSQHIRARILTCGSRDASVVHPPVAIDRFAPASEREDFYVVLGALVPYKRVDLAVEAFNRLGDRLVIIGDGPERRALESIAGRNIEFAGRLSDRAVADLLGRCRALVHAGVEDFGIALVEAHAAGAPVIAYSRGGAAEIVIDDPHRPESATGVFFHQQAAAAIERAVETFESRGFDTGVLRARAAEFAPERFLTGMRHVVRQFVSVAA